MLWVDAFHQVEKLAAKGLTNADAAGLILFGRAAQKLLEANTSPTNIIPGLTYDWYQAALPALGWFARGDHFRMDAGWKKRPYVDSGTLMGRLGNLAAELDAAHVPFSLVKNPRAAGAYSALALDAYHMMQKLDPKSADLHQPPPKKSAPPPPKHTTPIVVQPPPVAVTHPTTGATIVVEQPPFVADVPTAQLAQMPAPGGADDAPVGPPSVVVTPPPLTIEPHAPAPPPGGIVSQAARAILDSTPPVIAQPPPVAVQVPDVGPATPVDPGAPPATAQIDPLIPPYHRRPFRFSHDFGEREAGRAIAKTAAEALKKSKGNGDSAGLLLLLFATLALSD